MNDWELSETEFKAKRARQSWWAAGAVVVFLVIIPAVVGIARHSMIAWWLTVVLAVGLSFGVIIPVAVRWGYQEAAGKRRPDPVRDVSPRLVRMNVRVLKWFKVNLYVQIVGGLILAVVLLLSVL